jgi:formate dehydrogenase major subunit
MVEIEGERVLAASCIRKPRDGMVVNSQNERASTARKMVIELLIADQPAREDAHDQAAIVLQWADACRVERVSRFPRDRCDPSRLLDDSHVAMAVNLDACIHCNLCVRACREVQVNDVIGMAFRGARRRSCSTSTTRWASRPAWPAASAFRPARPAR